MELYTKVAYENSRHLTLSYSTSFGISSRMFSQEIRHHIYAVYGLVRIADEIVDTYKGVDARQILDNLELETYEAMKRQYSANPIVHAYALTAKKYDIDKKLIEPFFESMRMDLTPRLYTSNDYLRYIHGSAEVIGLMCLKVFCTGDNTKYEELRVGASALGSAYQKVNFLRDLAADYKQLGRLYFPDVTYENFDEEAKQAIVRDIKDDFKVAYTSLQALPLSSRRATMMSYVYYFELLKKLEQTPVDVIKSRRVRLPSGRKTVLLLKALLGQRLNRG